MFGGVGEPALEDLELHREREASFFHRYIRSIGSISKDFAKSLVGGIGPTRRKTFEASDQSLGAQTAAQKKLMQF